MNRFVYSHADLVAFGIEKPGLDPRIQAGSRAAGLVVVDELHVDMKEAGFKPVGREGESRLYPQPVEEEGKTE